jgi:flagellar protein FlaI
MIPIEEIGTPKFYPTLTRKMKNMKNPNLIYPLNELIAVHICPDKEGSREFYIPIEPVLASNFDDLVDKVELRIVTLVDTFDEPKNEEEKRDILEKCIDMVCETETNGGNNGNGNNGNGGLRNLFLKFRTKNNNKLQVTPEELKAIKYLMIRDKAGLGILEPFLHDPYIEDISCSGLGNIFIEHKIFESLRSPINFNTKEDLDAFIIKLSEKIGKPVSYRSPIVDAVLPDGSRINIVFGEDISKKGSNFTIRKFSETPISVLQLIEFGTFDYVIAAYLWICLHEGMNCFIAGETASGKTTTMNAITTFLPANAKIVSIEDTPELQVPHTNWIREVTRSALGKKEGEGAGVGMFDLLKAALRQRPNEIIIGEIRGEEGKIAFQSMQCIADGYILKADGGLVDIRELFENAKAKYSSEIESYKGKEVVKINDSSSNYGIFSANEDGVIKEARIEAIYKMPASELIEIETDDGLRLRVTPNHRFIGNIDGEKREITAKEILEDGDDINDIFVYTPGKIEIRGEKKNLWDFIDACDKKPNVVKDVEFKELEAEFKLMHRFYIKQIADALGTSRKRIEDYFKSRSKVVSWDIYKYMLDFFGNELPEEIKFRFKGARKDVRLKKELEDILPFLGIFFIRGGMYRNKIFLGISDDVAVKLPFEVKKVKNSYYVESSPLAWLIRDVFSFNGDDIPDTILKLGNSQLRYFTEGISACAEHYTLKTGDPWFWYALGRLIGDDSLYVSYNNGKIRGYVWQIKNTRICRLDRIFVDYLIKNRFIEFQDAPSGTTSRAVIKHVPYDRIPKEVLGAYLAGWFDSDWTIRKTKSGAIEIHCALDTLRNKGQEGKVLAVEQMAFISHLVSENVLPAIMGVEIRFHPSLRSEAEEIAGQIRKEMEEGHKLKLRLNEYQKGKEGIGMRVEFRSNKKEFSGVFKWWKENIMPYMFRKDKTEAVNELFKGDIENNGIVLEDKESKILSIRREKADKISFIFRDKRVKLDLLPEEDRGAILYLDDDNSNLTKIVKVKRSKDEVTYDISMDYGKYYIGGNYSLCYVEDTGHSVMSTFHAGSVEKLIQRMTGDPISVPKTYIDSLNLVIIQNAVRGKDSKMLRRVTSVNEIIGYDPISNSFSYVEIFKWNSVTDAFDFIGNMNSYLLEQKIAVKRRIPENKRRRIYKELEKRARMLQIIHKSGVTDFYDLFTVLSKIEREGVVV